MRSNSLLITLAILLLLATACSSTHNTAPVLERSNSGQKVQAPTLAESVKPAAPKGDERGYYKVKKGDTLQRIALDFGQNYRDLVTWNNLGNPNDIKIDQVLRVLPPDETNGGTQTASGPEPAGAQRVAALPPAVLNKTMPRGEKRPYSEAALAELQRPDSATATVTVTATPAVVTAPSMSPEKSAELAVPEEAVSWMWPVAGKPSGPYEEAKKGIDIAGKSGDQVAAAASGKVLYAGTMRGYGNLVIVKHSASLLSAYAHNKSILVKEGQSVFKGQTIAEMGDSDTDAVKLHFEIRQQGKPVDPTKFLPNR